jgi:hypothetical protein
MIHQHLLDLLSSGNGGIGSSFLALEAVLSVSEGTSQTLLLDEHRY